MRTMRRWFRGAAAGSVLVVTALWSVEADAQQSCRATGEAMSVEGLPEASGVAASRSTPGVLWSHNDSGEPILVAVGTDGKPRGRVRVSGATVGDWEDIDVGPCPQGSCIYIGDIGDNNARRRDVVIYRVPEPDAVAGSSAAAESMRLTYPDGPRDAEALIVLPNGNVFIVTKGERGPVALYRLPAAFRNGETAKLERVSTLVEANGNGGVERANRVTGASASPDGRWIVLRTLHALAFYSTATFTAGNARELMRYDVSGIRERQGEGVAFGSNGTVLLASEGGGNKRPGTIAKLECTLR